MLKSQFTEAFQLAKGDADLSAYPLDIFDGYGLRDFLPVACELGAFARLIRWQCLQFNGQFNQDALTDMYHFAVKRRRVEII